VDAQAFSFDTRLVNDAVIGLEAPSAASAHFKVGNTAPYSCSQSVPAGGTGSPLWHGEQVKLNGTRTDGADVPPVSFTITAKAVVIHRAPAPLCAPCIVQMVRACHSEGLARWGGTGGGNGGGFSLAGRAR
jgi:hypothetical protein